MGQRQAVWASLERELAQAWSQEGRVRALRYGGRDVVREDGLTWEALGVEDGTVGLQVEWERVWTWTGVLEGLTGRVTGEVTSVASLGEGRVASGSYDNTVRIWSADGRCERVDRKSVV